MFGRLHILPIVVDFLARYPAIMIDLQLADANVDLGTGGADVAVRIGELPDSGLMATRVGTMRKVWAAAPALLDRHRPPSSPEDLEALPAIMLDMPMPDAGAIGRSERLTVSSAEAAVDAAERGVGVVRLLHYQVADAMRAGRLRLLLESFEPEPAPVHVLHAPLAQLPRKIRLFLDFANGPLRAALLRIGAP